MRGARGARGFVGCGVVPSAPPVNDARVGKGFQPPGTCVRGCRIGGSANRTGELSYRSRSRGKWVGGPGAAAGDITNGHHGSRGSGGEPAQPVDASRGAAGRGGSRSPAVTNGDVHRELA